MVFNMFYLTVFAHSSFNNGQLEISGDNVDSVEGK